MGRNLSSQEALAELAQCRTEEEIVAWAAKHRGRGSAEIYAAIRERFAALREDTKEKLQRRICPSQD